MTSKEQWDEMNDRQRYEQLVRAELRAENAEFMLREQSGANARNRQEDIIRRIRYIRGGVVAA